MRVNINRDSIVNILFSLLNKKGIGIDGCVHRNGNVYYSTNRHVLVKVTLKQDDFKSQEQYIVDKNKQIKELKEIGKINTLEDLNILERSIQGEIKPLNSIFKINSYYLALFSKIIDKLDTSLFGVNIGQNTDDQLILFTENDDIKLEVFIMVMRK